MSLASSTVLRRPDRAATAYFDAFSRRDEAGIWPQARKYMLRLLFKAPSRPSIGSTTRNSGPYYGRSGAVAAMLEKFLHPGVRDYFAGCALPTFLRFPTC
jgi:hypothetical protein